MLKFMFMGDFELTRDRLPIARPILEHAASVFELEKCDVFVGTGDYIDEFTPDAVHYFRELMIDGFGCDKRLLIGNHDYNVPGIDRINAIFDESDGGIHIITHPKVEIFADIDGAETAVAFLPAPNRAMFGANRDAETHATRNAALTNALGSAVKALRLNLAGTDMTPAESILVAHGTPTGAVFPTGKRSHGLTWEIPTDVTRDFGKSLFGHIHRPYVMNDGQMVGVGGIAPWTHGDRDTQYYAVIVTVHDDKRIEHTWIPLLRQLHPVELFVRETGVYWEQTTMPGMAAIYSGETIEPIKIADGGETAELSFGGVDYLDADEFARGIMDIAAKQLPYSWRPADSIALKIRFQLPHAMMSQLPSDVEIRAAMMARISREPTGIHKVTLTRERTDETTAARIAGDHESMSLSQLFDEWCGINERAFDIETRNRAYDFINEMDVSDMFADGNFGMEPVRLSIRNFRQWVKADIDFADWNGAVAITGKNALGKSNIIESILFALFKRTPSSSGLMADEINNNATSGTATFEFNAGGKRYKVSRAMKRTKKGATCKTDFTMRHVADTTTEIGNMEFGVMPAPEWLPVAESAHDIDREIAGIVGSYEFVISTFFGTQTDIDRLVDATPSEMHELMLESLALHRFDELRDDVARRARDGNNHHDGLVRDIEAAERYAEKMRADLAVFKPVAEYDADIAAERESVDKYTGDRDKSIRTRDELQHDRDAAVKRMADKESFERELSKTRDVIGVSQREIAALGLRQSHEPPPAPEISSADLRVERGELGDRIHDRQRDIDKVVAVIRDVAAEIAGYKGTIESAANRIAAVDRDIAEIDHVEHPDVPCGELADYHPHPTCGDDGIDIDNPLISKCPAYRVMTDAGRRDSYVAENKQTSDAMADAQGDLTLAVKTESDARDEMDVLINENNAAAEQSREYDKRFNDAECVEKAIAAYAELAVAIEKAKEERNAFIDNAAILKSQIDILCDPAADVERCDKANAGLAEIIASCNDGISRHRERAMAIERNRIKATTLTDSLAQIISDIDKMEAERDGMVSVVHAWSLLTDAFSKNGGIPYLIMEKTVGGIRDETNRLLDGCGSGITVEINTTAETQAGDARDRVEIRFNDERGNHPLASASGYQRAVIGMSLRAAFSRIGSEFWGLVPAFFVQDEGWDRFHASARPIAGALIADLAETFETFVFITHIVSLGDYADTRIDVVGTNGHSEYKRIA